MLKQRYMLVLMYLFVDDSFFNLSGEGAPPFRYSENGDKPNRLTRNRGALTGEYLFTD